MPDIFPVDDESNESVPLSNELLNEIIDSLPQLDNTPLISVDESVEGLENMYDEELGQSFADGSLINADKERNTYDTQEIPDLSYIGNLTCVNVLENIEYPENIHDFHNDMPNIADKMDDVEFMVDPYIRPIRKTHIKEFHNDVPNKAYQMFGMDLSLVDPIRDIVETSSAPKSIISTDSNANNHAKLESKSQIKEASRKGKRIVVTKDPEFKPIIKDIEDTLLAKLTAGTNIKFSRVPWSVLTKQDLINWPEKMPIWRLSRQGKNNLRRLHGIISDVNFSKDFLGKLKYYIEVDNTDMEYFYFRKAVRRASGDLS